MEVFIVMKTKKNFDEPETSIEGVCLTHADATVLLKSCFTKNCDDAELSFKRGSIDTEKAEIWFDDPDGFDVSIIIEIQRHRIKML